MGAYFARGSQVYMQDGPWEVRLTPAQCDQLLAIWDEANAVTLFNALWQAMSDAGLEPSTFGRRHLRLVSSTPAREAVRAMLAASVAGLRNPEPPEAA